MIKKLGILLVVVLFSFSFAAENDNVLDAQDKAEEKNLREWIYGGIHEGTEIIKIITDFLPAGKAAKVLKTIKESWK